MEGLRTEHILFLVRKPHGAIASFIKGVKFGTINITIITKKAAWLKLFNLTSTLKRWN
jgi:hypothetical protein